MVAIRVRHGLLVRALIAELMLQLESVAEFVNLEAELALEPRCVRLIDVQVDVITWTGIRSRKPTDSDRATRNIRVTDVDVVLAVSA